jgi:hypothetical protein
VPTLQASTRDHLLSMCYKTEMKSTKRWQLLKYVGRELTPVSKPFKTRQAAERARAKLPAREQRTVAIGVLHPKH